MNTPAIDVVRSIVQAIPDRDLIPVELCDLSENTTVSGLADLVKEGGETILAAIIREVHETGTHDSNDINISKAVKAIDRVIEDARSIIRSLVALDNAGGGDATSFYR